MPTLLLPDDGDVWPAQFQQVAAGLRGILPAGASVEHIGTALRQCQHTREAYAALMRSLAQAHADDKQAYTEAKAPFVMQVLARVAAPPGTARPQPAAGAARVRQERDDDRDLRATDRRKAPT